jgi:hypothetical protein
VNRGQAIGSWAAAQAKKSDSRRDGKGEKMDLYLSGKKHGTLIASIVTPGSVHGGCDKLNQEQFDAYRYSKSLIASGPANYNKAKKTLEDAGFELVPSSRGPDDRLFDAAFLT